ncbi:MAG: hypothetical protein PHP44_15780, partial [Kiritimatiellae bacterium]|nr:hypothetical protein [Kiritimatiellia bacterium]
MQVTFELSIEEQAELNLYDEEIQQRVHMLLDCFKRVYKSHFIIKEACKHEAHVMGNKKPFTAGSIKRLYYTYIKSGDFRELIDKRLRKDIKRDKKGLSEETIEFFRSLCDQNKRSWIEEHCPEINYFTARSFYNLARGLVETLAIPAKMDLPLLLSS